MIYDGTKLDPNEIYAYLENAQATLRPYIETPLRIQKAILGPAYGNAHGDDVDNAFTMGTAIRAGTSARAPARRGATTSSESSPASTGGAHSSSSSASRSARPSTTRRVGAVP